MYEIVVTLIGIIVGIMVHCQGVSKYQLQINLRYNQSQNIPEQGE